MPMDPRFLVPRRKPSAGAGIVYLLTEENDYLLSEDDLYLIL